MDTVRLTADLQSFIKIDTDIEKLLREIHIQTHRQQGELISLLLFFHRESRLKWITGETMGVHVD